MAEAARNSQNDQADWLVREIAAPQCAREMEVMAGSRGYTARQKIDCRWLAILLIYVIT